MDYNLVGPALVIGLSSLGSAIGCGIAGAASHGVMSRVEEGHGKFLGMSAAPSSQCIYGFVLMLLMQGKIATGAISAMSGIGIGAFAGLGIMFSAIYQGRCCASGIQASAKQPSIFGKCFLAVGIVESFALFAMIGAILMMG